jgi:CIC family chloride channel protein
LDLVGYTVLGIVAGVVGSIEPTIFYGIRDFFKSLKVPNHIKPAIGGLLMGLLALVVPQTISTGYGWVQQAITGGYAGWSLFLLAFAKILAMSLTISSGGSGGVFGPNVYIGAMVGAWTAFALDHLFALHLSTAAFAVVGMAAVFAGTARVPIATLVMVAEMTGGYGLIVPSMLATSIAFVVQRTVGARFRYPRLYEAQVELLKDSPTHHKNLLQVAFELLKKDTQIDTSELSLPQLADLLRLDKTLSVHNGQVELFAMDISKRSKLAGRTVAQAFGEFPNLILVAVIRDNQVSVPRGAMVLSLGDRLLIAADVAAKDRWTATMSKLSEHSSATQDLQKERDAAAREI